MMKKLLIILLLVSFTLMACEKKQATTTQSTPKSITLESLATMEDKASYGMGYDMGKKFNQLGFDINSDIFSKGLSDGLSSAESPLLSEDEIKQSMKDFQKAVRTKRQEERKKESTENKEKGKKYLEENKKKDGVVTLESGLQYKVITEGTGEIPKLTDKVQCHYEGKTIDGTVFDSSLKRKKPATFSVNRVVKGWTEALQLMKVGSKWQIFIPFELGYGERGAGRKIGPNETLIFELELIGIEPPKKPKTDKTKKPAPAGKEKKPAEKAVKKK